MKIRIQNINKFIDVDVAHPYLLGDINVYERDLKPKIQDIINRYKLKCSGCGKPLFNSEVELKDMRTLFLFCSDSVQDCLNKWKGRCPK